MRFLAQSVKLAQMRFSLVGKATVAIVCEVTGSLLQHTYFITNAAIYIHTVRVTFLQKI